MPRLLLLLLLSITFRDTGAKEAVTFEQFGQLAGVTAYLHIHVELSISSAAAKRELRLGNGRPQLHAYLREHLHLQLHLEEGDARPPGRPLREVDDPPECQALVQGGPASPSRPRGHGRERGHPPEVLTGDAQS